MTGVLRKSRDLMVSEALWSLMHLRLCSIPFRSEKVLLDRLGRRDLGICIVHEGRLLLLQPLSDVFHFRFFMFFRATISNHSGE